MKTLTLTSMLSLLLVFSFNYAEAAQVFPQQFVIENNSQVPVSVTIVYTHGSALLSNDQSDLDSWGCTSYKNTFTCSKYPPQAGPLTVTENGSGHVDIVENGNEDSWYYQVSEDSSSLYFSLYYPNKNSNLDPYTQANGYEAPTWYPALITIYPS